MTGSPISSEGPLKWARSVWDFYARADAPWAVLATRNMEQFWKSGEIEIAALAARGLIQPGHRVADLGCGLGRLSLPLARQVAAVTAVDVSSEMLTRLKQRAAAHPNLQTWLLKDGGFPEGPFEAIVSFLVLQHQPPHVARGLLASARAALAPGGKILIDLPVVGWEPPSGAQTLWRDIPADDLWESRLYRWDEAAQLLFEPAGLRVASLESERPTRTEQVIVLEDAGASEEERAGAGVRAARLEAAAVLEQYFLERDSPPTFTGREPAWTKWLRQRGRRAAQAILRRAHALAFPREAEVRRLLAEICRSAANGGPAPAPPRNGGRQGKR